MTNDQKIISTKVGLLETGKQLGNVSQTCKIMGYSRDSAGREINLGRKNFAQISNLTDTKKGWL